MKKQSKITVFEVAKLAGVSIATVSRALNKPDAVSTDLRNRVLAATAKLDYQINSSAKALRRRRTQIIGTILPRLNDALFCEIAHGIQASLVESGYVGFLQTAGFDNRKLVEHAKHLIDRGAEGLIVFGRIDDEKLVSLLKASRIPCVTIYSYLEDSPVPCIGIDNYNSAQQLISLILQLGHTRIGMISGPVNGNDRQQARIKAFRDMLGRRGLQPVVQTIEKSYTLTDGGEALRRLYAMHPEITAVICNSDVIAFGVLAECRKLGLAVPGDISVTGFDDVSFAPLLDPSLTTVSVEAAEMGRQAVLSLIHNLDEGQPILSSRFETAVILRKSTCTPRLSAEEAA